MMGYAAKVTAAGVVLALLASCANGPFSSGRYLQIRHAVSDRVMAQITWPTATACANVRTALQTSSDARQRMMFNATSCSETSMASNLPYRVAMRDKPGDYLFDMDTIDLDTCTLMVYQFMSASARAIAQVDHCKAK